MAHKTKWNKSTILGAFKSIFGRTLCCLFEPGHGPNWPFGGNKLWGKEKRWQDVHWLLQALEELPTGNTAWFMNRVCLKVTVTGATVQYNGGIPHSAIQCWVSCPNKKSQLWSGFMHIHRDETSCATQAISQWAVLIAVGSPRTVQSKQTNHISPWALVV